MAKAPPAPDSAASSSEEIENLTLLVDTLNTLINANNIEGIREFASLMNTEDEKDAYSVLTSKREGEKSPIENALDSGNPEILGPILSCIRGEEQINDFMSYVTPEEARFIEPLLSDEFRKDLDKVKHKLTEQLLTPIISSISEGDQDKTISLLTGILDGTGIDDWYKMLDTKSEDGKSPLNHILEKKQSKLMGAVVNFLTSEDELKDLLSEDKTTREEKLFIIDSCKKRNDLKHVLSCLPEKDIIEFSLGKQGPEKIESLKKQIQNYTKSKSKDQLEGIKEKMEEISGAVEYSTSKNLNYRENVKIVAKHIGSIFREAAGSTEDLTTKQKLSNLFQSFCEKLGVKTERQKAKELFQSSAMFAGIREALTKTAPDGHTPPPPSAAAAGRGKGGAEGHRL